MSEEVRDASVAVPRAMITVFLLDCALIFPLVVTICYHITDVQAALNDATTYPGIYVMRGAMSNAWIAVVLAIITFIVMASNVTYLAAVSRDLFAFSRDKGVPFSPWLSKVDPKRNIPQNASAFSCVLAGLLALIYIGSPVAYYAITSLGTAALLQCYICAIGSVLWRRLAKPETLPVTRFSLGRWGVPINVMAVLYSIWSFFWVFWPQAQPVTASGFNWAGPIFVIAILGAALYYIKARHHYKGPVTIVEGRFVERDHSVE
jgi:choline transport protein